MSYTDTGQANNLWNFLNYPVSWFHTCLNNLLRCINLVTSDATEWFQKNPENTWKFEFFCILYWHCYGFVHTKNSWKCKHFVRKFYVKSSISGSFLFWKWWRWYNSPCITVCNDLNQIEVYNILRDKPKIPMACYQGSNFKRAHLSRPVSKGRWGHKEWFKIKAHQDQARRHFTAVVAFLKFELRLLCHSTNFYYIEHPLCIAFKQSFNKNFGW